MLIGMRIGAIAAACVVVCGGSGLLRAAEERPNVVMFLVDDWGWTSTSCVLSPERMGNHEWFHTPNMERLAASGMSFSQAYAASPVCSPTRTSLLTGKNPARTGITTWINARGPDAKTKAADERLLVPRWNTVGLTPEDVTLPGVLRGAGYATWHLGKAHFGLKGHAGADPTRLGFDVNVGGSHTGGPGSYQGKRRYSRTGKDGHEYQVRGVEEFYGTETHLTDALTVKACELVREAEERDEQPFFMHFAHYGVHTPIQPHARFMERYAESGRSKPQQEFASMVEGIDASLGAVLDALVETGELENTIVILYSDNGGLEAHSGPPTDNLPLRGGKGTCFEGGVRVPLIVSWPGHTEAGSVCATPVISDDFFPTILSACGVSENAWESVALDGVDFGPLLEGEEMTPRGSDMVWHFPHYWGWPGLRAKESFGVMPFSSIRVGDHRLIYDYDRESVQLYDLASDLGERHDLAAEEPELARELCDRLAARLKELGAQTPRSRETGESVALPHCGE
jgi:arylsulfatase A-like enzyme